MEWWSMPDSLEWRSQGKCRGMDPQLFYPQPNSKGIVPKAAQLACKNCPVVNQCYDWALRNEIFGYWAGLDERQREGRRRAAGIIPKRWNYDPRILAPHGTDAAHQRHVRAGEEPCQACLAAHSMMKNPQGKRALWDKAKPTCQGERDVAAVQYQAEVEETGQIRFRFG